MLHRLCLASTTLTAYKNRLGRARLFQIAESAVSHRVNMRPRIIGFRKACQVIVKAVNALEWIQGNENLSTEGVNNVGVKA